MEIWKDAIEYQCFYEVSSLGRIRRKKTGRILKPQISNSGYYRICLSLFGFKTYESIHRIVARSFFGGSELDINHIDGNKLNNSIHNLEYVTRSQNSRHASLNNLYSHKKISDPQKIWIRNLKGKFKQKDLAYMFQVDPSTISRIQNMDRYFN